MTVRHYVFLGTDGYIKLPDGSKPYPQEESTSEIYVFGFAGGLYRVNDKVVNEDLDWTKEENWVKFCELAGRATIPSPLICGEVGDDICITLINLGGSEVDDLKFCNININAIDVSVEADEGCGVSFAVPVWVDKSKQPPNITYHFRPERPGTYLYYCDNTVDNIQMGMYGAMVVYPSKKSLAAAGIRQNRHGQWLYKEYPQPHIPVTATNRNFAYNNISSYFDRENLMLLSDMDSRQHGNVCKGIRFNLKEFRPDCWLINGRSFPDTLLSGQQEHDAKQIGYDSYVQMKTGDKLLLRMLNIGYQAVPWHIHGLRFAVMGKDANPSPLLKLSRKLGIKMSDGLDQASTVNISSGETYDLFLQAEDKRSGLKEKRIKNLNGLVSVYARNPILADNRNANADTETEEPGNVLEKQKNEATEWASHFYPMYNHDYCKLSNNGNYPGGQLTYIQIDMQPQHLQEELKPKEHHKHKKAKHKSDHCEIEKHDEINNHHAFNLEHGQEAKMTEEVGSGAFVYEEERKSNLAESEKIIDELPEQKNEYPESDSYFLNNPRRRRRHRHYYVNYDINKMS